MLMKKESPEKVGSASVTSPPPPPPQVALLHPISCQGLVPRFLGVRVEVVLPAAKRPTLAASHATLVPASCISLQFSFVCAVASLLVSSVLTSLAF